MTSLRVKCINFVMGKFVEYVRRADMKIVNFPQRHGLARANVRGFTNILKLCIWLSCKDFTLIPGSRKEKIDNFIRHLTEQLSESERVH